MIKRIGISTSVFDADGARTIAVDSKTFFNSDSGSRRVTRTATLDGGSTIYDTGFAVSDLTINVTSITDSEDIGNWFAYIVQNYNSVNLITPRGMFYAVPKKWNVNNGLPVLTLMVTEQVV